jgi:large subunit ribosomal protein L25
MSKTKQLSAKRRESAGKGAARAVRREGRVPAVVYGAGAPPVAISLDYAVAHKLIFAGHFLTTLFDIDVDGEKIRAIPRDYQFDPVKDTPIHIDFLRLGKDSKVRVEVPVHFVNHEASPGLKRGGVLNIVRHAVELMVPADAIPESLTADLKGLDLNDSVHISAINLPEGAKPTIGDRDFTIATIAVPAGFKEDEEKPADAAAAPAAGAAKAPAAAPAAKK